MKYFDSELAVEIAIAITAFCSIVMIVITSRTYYQLFIQDASDWTNKTYRYLTVSIMILFTLCSIGDTIHMSIYLEIKPDDGNDDLRPYTRDNNYVSVGMDLCYFIGNVLFYILISLRIAIPFELSRFCATLLAVCIVFFAVASIVYSTFLIMDFDISNYYEWIPVVFTFSFTDAVMSPIIFFIFIQKMRQTILNVDPTISYEAKRNVNHIANVMIKHSVLFGIAIIMNQGFYVVLIYRHLRSRFGVGNVYVIGYGVRAIENITNVSILCLVLRVNYSVYMGLCRCCHACVGKCCFRSIDSDSVMKNPYRRPTRPAERNPSVNSISLLADSETKQIPDSFGKHSILVSITK